MKNKSKIKGDKNISIQNTSSSKISIGKKKDDNNKQNNFWIILPVIIGIIALIVQILIGWKEIINWFYDK